MTTAVAMRESQPVQAFSVEQIDLLKKTIAKGCTDEELALFGMICQRSGLDPFARQIYAVKRRDTSEGGEGSRMIVQTSIDGYRLIADRTGRYAGSAEPVYDTETAAHPGWAKVTVYKLVGGHLCPFTATARWEEYCQTFYNQKTRSQELGAMWKRMPYLMLGKCAESLALRKAFPQELSGLYTQDELAQTESGPVPPAPVLMRPQELFDEGHPLVERINGLLTEQGLSEGDVATYWAKMDKKYAGRTPESLELLYQGLQKAVDKKRVAGPALLVQPAVSEAGTPQGRAWDVLREHQDDAQLTPAILEQIGAALATPASDDDAEKLAGLVMDWLDSREEVEVTI